MPRKIITSKDAPKPIGPYNQAVIAGGFLFCSGQVGIDPATGEVVAGGVAAQTEQVLKNLTRRAPRGQDGARERGEGHRLPPGHGRLSRR